MCCHWQWHYFEVSNINRDESLKCKTVKGTLSFHSVCNVGIPGIIEVHESSCFCEVCFFSESGQCKNGHLVEDFAWASLYKNQQIEDHFENKVWECYSVPYRYAKKNILKSKPKRQNPKIKNKSKNSKVGKKMLQKGPSISHISSRITLMIQTQRTLTMRTTYLYRLSKKDLIQCLWSPLFVEE